MTDFADWPLGKRLDFKVTEALMQSNGDDVTDGVRALTILLSEPELVAGLDLKVKVALLGQLLDQLRDQAGYHYVNVDGHLALVCPDPIREGVTPDEVRLSVLTPRERMALEIGLLELGLSKAEAKALTPEVPRVG